MSWQWLEIGVKVVLTLWMLRISVLDHYTGRVPNALTAPVFLGVGAYRMLFEGLVQGNAWRFGLLVTWAIIFGLWMLHFIGGGDAKFLMALFALFPSMEFAGVLAFLMLPITLALLLWDIRGSDRSLGERMRAGVARLYTGQILPTEQELQEKGRRYAWTFAVPSIVYAWLYWAWPPAPGWWP